MHRNLIVVIVAKFLIAALLPSAIAQTQQSKTKDAQLIEDLARSEACFVLRSTLIEVGQVNALENGGMDIYLKKLLTHGTFLTYRIENLQPGPGDTVMIDLFKSWNRKAKILAGQDKNFSYSLADRIAGNKNCELLAAQLPYD